MLLPPENLNVGLWIPKKTEHEEAGDYSAMPGGTELYRSEQQGRALPTRVVSPKLSISFCAWTAGSLHFYGSNSDLYLCSGLQEAEIYVEKCYLCKS